MTGISKIFYQVSSGKTCEHFQHPHIESCRQHFFDLLLKLIPGGFKLYVPLLIIPPLLKGRQVTWKYLKRHFWEYFDLSWKTYFQAMAATLSVCVC